MAERQGQRDENVGDWAAALARLKEEFRTALFTCEQRAREIEFAVGPEALADFVAALRQEVLVPGAWGFCDACGVDRGEWLEAVYRFSSVRESRQIIVRTRVPRERPLLPTLSHLFIGTLWPEREMAEMFGFQFEGHPDPRPLLLPEGWEGYPLRKDYVPPLDHPYLARDPLREDPAKILAEKTESPGTKIKEGG